MSTHTKARIIGLGAYLPSAILSNHDLEGMVETSDEWIVSRTGIRERRIASQDEFPSDMGKKAAKIAIESSGIAVEAIDLILVATMSPDYISPSTASLIQASIGAENAAACDIQAACTGFLYGLSMAKAYIESHQYQTILVIATEKMSSFIDYSDRSTCILFGDGAGAALVSSKGKGLAIDSICLGSDGTLADLLKIPAGGARLPASSETVLNLDHFIKMSGNEIFKHAVRRMNAASEKALSLAGLEISQISWLIPHQANTRIISALSKQFELDEKKVYLTIQKYGNTSASSIVIALTELMAQQALKESEHLLLTAFGGGLTWGAAVLTQTSSSS